MVAGVRKDAYYAPVAVMHGFGSTKEKGHRPRVPFKEQNVTDRLKFCLSRWSRLCLLGPSVVATIDCGPQVLQMYHRQGACPIGVRPRVAPNWCLKIQFETPICSIGVRRRRFHAEISGVARPAPADRRQRRPRPRASSWPLWAHRPSSIVQRITFLPAGWVQATIARVVWGWSLESLTQPLNGPPCVALCAGSGRGERASVKHGFIFHKASAWQKCWARLCLRP